jgi:hypothetical protein
MTDLSPSDRSWQINFLTSNIPTASLKLDPNSNPNVQIQLKFISMSNEEIIEIPPIEINMKEDSKRFQSSCEDLFVIPLNLIEPPKEIQWKMIVDQSDQFTFKWHLDCVRTIEHIRFI